MFPLTREDYLHVLIEVTYDEPQPRPERFTWPGFYEVADCACRCQDSCSSHLPSPPERAAGSGSV